MPKTLPTRHNLILNQKLVNCQQNRPIIAEAYQQYISLMLSSTDSKVTTSLYSITK